MKGTSWNFFWLFGAIRGTLQTDMQFTQYDSLKYLLQERLNHQLSQKNWTLKTLSDQSGVPYETLKKLANAKIDNPSLQSVCKVAQAFDCSLDSFLGDEPELIHKIHSLSPRSVQFLEAMADVELALTVRTKQQSQTLIPIVVPTGAMEDGMIYDSLLTEYIDISPYLKQFGSQLFCAFKIIGNQFQPTYLDGDLLLVGRNQQPHYGTVGIFLHHNQLYLRRYVTESPLQLESINENHFFEPIKHPEEWTLFGCVLTVIR